MSLLANVDDLAFASLLRMRGEVVTFRGVQLKALINRLPSAKNPPGSVEISTLIGSVVQLPATINAVEKGETVIDSKGFTHRFTKIPTWLGHCWSCESEVS
jgi:hypothetical protein